MDPWIFNIILNEDILEINAQDAVRITQRALRDASNPFELPVAKFKKMFRLITPEIALNFYRRIEPLLEEPQRMTSIPNHLKAKLVYLPIYGEKRFICMLSKEIFQFLAALYFYSQGSYQTNVGRDYNIAISQPSMSRCVRLISEVISTIILHEYVKFPTSNEDMQRVKGRFMEKFNFPNVIGCLDGTHISITQPAENDPVRPGIVYLNRKNFYSINTQLICDADLKILAVNARFQDTHDSAIWQMSNIRRHLEARYLDGLHNFYLLGDSGYPLQPCVMTPILDVPEDTPEGRYTRAHCYTRNTIERCIGLLKSRFKCLREHRSLHYHPVTTGKIIYSCVVLHNICIDANIEYEGEIIQEEIEIADDAPANDLHPNLLRLARDVQRNIVQHFM